MKEKSLINANSANMLQSRQPAFGVTRKRTVKTKLTSAISVNMHLLTRAIWEGIWRYTIEKHPITATSVNMPLINQVILKGICWPTVKSSPTNVNYVIMKHTRQAVWWSTLENTIGELQLASMFDPRQLQFQNWADIHKIWKHCIFVAGMLKTAFFAWRNSVVSIFVANVSKISTYALWG